MAYTRKPSSGEDRGPGSGRRTTRGEPSREARRADRRRSGRRPDATAGVDEATRPAADPEAHVRWPDRVAARRRPDLPRTQPRRRDVDPTSRVEPSPAPARRAAGPTPSSPRTRRTQSGAVDPPAVSSRPSDTGCRGAQARARDDARPGPRRSAGASQRRIPEARQRRVGHPPRARRPRSTRRDRPA